MHQAPGSERSGSGSGAESQDYYPLLSPRRPSPCVYFHVVNAMPILSRPHSGPTMESRMPVSIVTTKLRGPVPAQRKDLFPGTQGSRIRRVLEIPLVYFAVRRSVS